MSLGDQQFSIVGKHSSSYAITVPATKFSVYPPLILTYYTIVGVLPDPAFGLTFTEIALEIQTQSTLAIPPFF